MASDTVGHGVPRILQQLCSSPTGGEHIASVRHALQTEIVAASGPSVPPRNGAAGASRARGPRGAVSLPVLNPLASLLALADLLVARVALLAGGKW